MVAVSERQKSPDPDESFALADLVEKNDPYDTDVFMISEFDHHSDEFLLFQVFGHQIATSEWIPKQMMLEQFKHYRGRVVLEQ